jgi:hypothetical protein
MVKAELTTAFVDYLEKSSIHDLNSIRIAKNNFLRLIWIISILISASLCGYSIIKSINDYLSFEVMTKIREINEVKSIFPTISICNRNIFTNEYGYNYLKNYSEKNNETDTFYNPTMEIIRSNEFVHRAAANYMKDEKLKEKRKLIDYPIKDILLSCRFNLRECDDNDFEWVYHYKYGNCYKFNSEKSASISSNIAFMPGKANGFTVELYVDINKKLSQLTNGKGISIIIGNASHNFDDTDGLYLTPGKC